MTRAGRTRAVAARGATRAATAAALPQARHREHWRRNLALTGALLAVSSLVTFGVAWYARDLNFDFFGWPFSFYVGAQGALAVYLLVVVVYAVAMDRLDRRCGVAEPEE